MSSPNIEKLQAQLSLVPSMENRIKNRGDPRRSWKREARSKKSVSTSKSNGRVIREEYSNFTVTQSEGKWPIDVETYQEKRVVVVDPEQPQARW